MLYDLLLAKSLNGGGGGGGSAAPLFVEFASEGEYSYDAQGYHAFENLTCSETPGSIAAAIEAGRIVYATFTDGNSMFSSYIIPLVAVWKDESGKVNDIVFGKTVTENDPGANVMRIYRVRIDAYEDIENPGTWYTEAESHYCWVEAYTT